jgi:hypothetical protein
MSKQLLEKTIQIPVKDAVVIFAPKILKLMTSFIIANIAANYMSQIYMDKVLINQENPPHLQNFVSMFLLIDVLLMFIIMLIFYVVSMTFFPMTINVSNVIKKIGVDYAIGLGILALFGYMVSNTMYNKKYFMYKDDGLRAIRALKEMMLYVSISVTIIPFFIAL